MSSQVTALVAGTTYFARVTAVDTSGNESACSAAASGVAQPDFSVTPSGTTSFGSVALNSTADQTFTVQNTGTTTVSGTATIGAPYSIVAGSAFLLAAGASQTVTVRFRPTTAGTFAGNVNITADGDTISRSVTGSATGAPATVTLSLTKGGAGSGTVTSSPAGMNCGATCTLSVASGTAVTLTATAASGSTFAGWSAPCSGTGTCVATVNAATTVTATFTPTPAAPPPSPAAEPAAPGNPSVSQVTSDATGVTFRFAWLVATDASAYRYTVAFDDGSGTQQGSVTGSSVQLKVPYHASGAATTGYVCIQSVNSAGVTSTSVSCSALEMPARPAPGPVTLSVSKTGSGGGTVTSVPAGISCGTTCALSVTPGTAVTLTATAVAGSTFAGWSAPCSGTGACVVPVNAATTVTATFNVAPVTPPTLPASPPAAPGNPSVTQVGADATGVTFTFVWAAAADATSYRYTVAFDDGSGIQQGSVTSSSAQVKLPYHASGAAVTGYVCIQSVSAAGATSASVSCTAIAMPARPAPSPVTLSISKTGTGAGTVTSVPAGISCGTACSQSVTPGAARTLTATPAAGSFFAGWSGACSGTGTCALTVDAATSVTARFELFPVLSIVKSGAGTGTVLSAPAGISCGVTCSQSLAPGTGRTLTATPATGSFFAGWSGACSGTGTCAVTVNAATSVTATFELFPVLSIVKSGTGAGVVSGSGISCGWTCTQSVAPGTVRTLTAAPVTGSYFAGWSGPCSGTSTCVVTVSAATSVTATFDQTVPVTLSIVKNGTGAGTVTSSPAGISCGTTCSQSVTAGTARTLTATPAAGSVFAGWSGACSGTGTCTLTITAATSATATFDRTPVTLSVVKSGPGTGTVTSAPAGISCGAICAQSVAPGTTVTLTATPAVGSTFTGWAGACSGTATCSMTVNAASSVTATFGVAPAAPASPPGAAGSPSVTLLAADTTGITFRFAWTAGAGATSYRYTIAFDDGSATQQGTVAGLSVQLKMPYHASGAASGGFVCIESMNAAGQTSGELSCAGIAVSARP
jgi:hypothetical protein